MVVRFYFRLLSQNVLEVSKEFREARTQLYFVTVFTGEGDTPWTSWWGRQLGQSLTLVQTKICNFSVPFLDLAFIVQRLDNFIQWISHYPTVSICANISLYRVQANMHTLTTVKIGSVRKVNLGQRLSEVYFRP